MNLQQKTPLQKNIEKIEEANRTTLLAVSSAISALNNSYRLFWGLPENELLELLQHLYENEKLQEVFINHFTAASALNTIRNAGGFGGPTAIAAAAREIEVNDGVVSFVEVEASTEPDGVEGEEDWDNIEEDQQT